jgi:hypothetical protein
MKKSFLILLFQFSFLLIKSQTLNYYFGNLHAHTGFSDGNKDSVASGVWSPSGSYAYAKLSQHFDFLGIAEHNHFSSSKNPGFRKQNYQAGLNMAAASNQNGQFASLFGTEWGVSSNYNGHVIIYGFNQLIGWETAVSGVVGPNYEIYNAKNDYDGLFMKVKNNPNAFAYLAHPYFTDFTTNGNASTSLAYGTYNAAYDSAIVGMPLRSGLAFSTVNDYSDFSQGNYFDYYKKILNQGYHLGIGYDHDNHNTNFGRGNSGRLVILAPSISPANIINAMQQMRFYGSDDWNAKIDFTLNGQIMGSITSGGTFPLIQVTHNDDDGELADSIKIWKGYKNSGGLWANIVHTSLQNNTASFTDYDLQSGIEYYYFAEIKQKDGDWIMTSPIWYNAQAPLNVANEHKKIDFNFFPNPVTKNLSISISNPGEHNIAIIDLTGRKVYEIKTTSSDCNILLENLNAGIYSLEVKNSESVTIKKLLIE